jgi:hypothetical protein
MKRSTGKRVLRHVGLPSAVAVAILVSGVGVAGATTTPSRSMTMLAALGLRDAGTNTRPPMPPGGPRGIGGGVKVERLVGAQGTIGSSPKSNYGATIGNVAPELGNVLPSSEGPDPHSGLMGGGQFARGPPLTD